MSATAGVAEAGRWEIRRDMVGYAPSVGRKTIHTGKRVDLLEVGGRGESKPGSIRGGKVGDQQPRASYQIRAMGGNISRSDACNTNWPRQVQPDLRR